MEARTINVPVMVPESFRTDLLQEQLTAYARQLIAKATGKKQKKYRHESLCGILDTPSEQETLVEDYLTEKYYP